MTETRGYQTDFSAHNDYVFDLEDRRRKAKTIRCVLEEELGSIDSVRVLNVGGGAGAIDYCLAPCVKQVISVDIDQQSMKHGAENFSQENLSYSVADGMKLPFIDNQFDVVLCSHVYEHVPDANVLMSEIMRVMSSEGRCYFAAGNRFQVMEPHYKLPFLSVFPKPVGDFYMRLAGKGDEYYEKHLSLSGLRKLVKDFEVVDYTERILVNPEKYAAAYMIGPGSLKQRFAIWLYRYLTFVFPGYIWLLKKPRAR